MSAARVQAGARAAVDALVRACASVRLYGPGHAVARGACESCASALAGLLAAATPATLRVTPAALVLESDGSREEAGGGELAAALHARNIGSLRVETAPTGADVERLGLALAASGGDGPTGRIGPFTLTPISYSGLGSGAGRGGEGLSWESLLRAAEGPGGQHAALGEVLGGGPPGAGAAKIVEALRGVGTSDAGVERLRGVLSGLSPEVRSQLLGVGDWSGGASLDDLDVLAAVIPVRETCEALRRVDQGSRHASAASLRLFRRLASLAPREPGALSEVAAHAGSWASTTNAAEEAAAALESLAQLCAQASACGFIPEDYEARLNQIAAGAAVAGDVVLAEGADPSVRVCEVMVRVCDSGTPDGNVLARLGELLPAVVEAGRPDVAGAIAGLARRGLGAADSGVAERAEALARAASDAPTLARAVARCASDGVLGDAVAPLREAAGGREGEVVALAAGLSPTPAARSFIRARLEQALARDAVAALRLLGEHPAAFCLNVAALGRRPAQEAFATTRAALDGAAERAPVYRAAGAMPHPWPDWLIVRGLIDPDPTARAAVIDHLRDRSSDGALLRRRLAWGLGGPPAGTMERREIVRALSAIDRRCGTGHLLRARRAASWGVTPRSVATVRQIACEIARVGAQVPAAERALTACGPAALAARFLPGGAS